jgi:hypothetical protein
MTSPYFRHFLSDLREIRNDRFPRSVTEELWLLWTGHFTERSKGKCIYTSNFLISCHVYVQFSATEHEHFEPCEDRYSENHASFTGVKKTAHIFYIFRPNWTKHDTEDGPSIPLTRTRFVKIVSSIHTLRKCINKVWSILPLSLDRPEWKSIHQIWTQRNGRYAETATLHYKA